MVDHSITTFPPSVDSAVKGTVQSALMDETCTKATYMRSDGMRATSQVLSPIGLVLGAEVLYLVAANHMRSPEARAYPLHRMTAAQRTYDPVRVPQGFGLQGFFDTGGMQFGLRGHVQLQAWISPMSADQEITHDEAGRSRLKVTVLDTWRMRGPLSNAGELVMTQPQTLNESLQESLAQAAKQYGSPEAPIF